LTKKQKALLETYSARKDNVERLLQAPRPDYEAAHALEHEMHRSFVRDVGNDLLNGLAMRECIRVLLQVQALEIRFS